MTDVSGPWSEVGYADIVRADRSGSDIEVTFANGDAVILPAARFGVTGDFILATDPDEGLSVRVSTPAGQSFLLPWTQIRAAADQDFAQELRRRETEEARRIGLRLRALREDKNLNQRDVAKSVGMSAPQLSKIESGSLDLRVSTVQSLLRAMGASFADIAGDAPEVSQKAVIKSAERAGVPRDVVTGLVSASPRGSLARVVERAFGWRIDRLVAGELGRPALPPAVAFKATRSGKDPSESPLVMLGQTIAEIVREAATVSPFQELPVDGRAINVEARDESGHVTLPSLAKWAWNKGLPVVPLAGAGGFSAAVWSGSASPVVVLKESRELAIYWLFDLAHECAHLALGHVGRDGLVDVDAPAPRLNSPDATEKAANQFALDILLPGHEQLLQDVRREARGSYLRFKGAVAAVAASANVSAGLLGMVAAYALTEVGQDKDRWGSATNLARADGTGREQVQAVARPFLSSKTLDDVDSLLIRVLVIGTT
jgi:transcriptional regulator with XRE-family HTH domain